MIIFHELGIPFLTHQFLKDDVADLKTAHTGSFPQPTIWQLGTAECFRHCWNVPWESLRGFSMIAVGDFHAITWLQIITLVISVFLQLHIDLVLLSEWFNVHFESHVFYTQVNAETWSLESPFQKQIGDPKRSICIHFELGHPMWNHTL